MSLSTTKTILIIDDDLSIRFVLKKLILRFFLNIKIFTSEDGVQGVGYSYILKPDLIVIDSSLPKYSGRELVDFLVTNKKFKHTPVVVLSEKNKKITSKLPANYIEVEKDSTDFPLNLIKTIQSKLDPIKAGVLVLPTRNIFLDISNFLARKVAQYSGKSNSRYQKIHDRYIFNGRIFYTLAFLFNQILVGFYLSFFYLLMGFNEREENVDQLKKDQEEYRTKIYPAIGIALATFTFVILLSFGGILSTSLFGSRPLEAASYTWDGGGTDGTCGGAAGDGNKWSCAANWSTNIVPVAADTITFNSTSTKDATIDASFQGTLNTLNINSGYTGTITQARAFTVGSLITASGNYTATDQALTINFLTMNTGSTFTASSGTTTISQGLTISGGNFIHNSGKILFNGVGSPSLNCNNAIFNLVGFPTSFGTININSNCSFPLGDSPAILGSINLSGTLSGTGTLNDTGGMTIQASGVLSGFTGMSQFTLTFSGATLDASSYSSFNVSSLTVNSGSLKVPVNSSMTNLTLSGGTFTASSGTMSLQGNLTFSGTGIFNANGGTINFNGINSTLSCNNKVFNFITFNQTTGGTLNIANNCNLPLGNNPTIFSSGTSLSLSGTLSGTGTLTLNTSTTYNYGALLSGFTSLVTNSTFVVTATTGSNLLDLSSYANVTFNGGFFVSTPTGSFTNSLKAPSLISSTGTFTLSPGSNFLANGGTVTFFGGGGNITCNNAVFNSVIFNNTSAFTVASNCNLPLGNNPTIKNGVTLNGTLSGTGVITHTGGTLTLNSTAVLSGFTGLSGTTGNTLTTVGTFDFSNYSPFIVGSSLQLTSGTLTIPNNSDLNYVTLSAGTFNAPSGNITISGNLTIGATVIYNHNNGTTTFDGTVANFINCANTRFYNVILNTGGSVQESGTCTIMNDFTLTTGTWTNPSSAAAINVSGNFNENANSTFGGANLTVNFVGTGTQNINKTTGTFSSKLNINNTGIVKLLTPFVVTTQTCAISAGVFSLNGQTFTCAGGFSVASGATLQLQGTEVPTVPTLSAGSIVKYTGNGDSGVNSYTLANWTYSNLIINAVDGVNDTFNFNNNFTPAALTLTAGTIGKSAGATTLTTSGLVTINGATWNPGTLNITANAGITCSSGVFNAATATLAVNGDLNLSGCNMTAPSGTVAVTGNFAHSSGTFTHNNGTINLTGSGKAISGSTSFYNLYKTTSVADTLNFQAGTTQTIVGTLRLRGIAGNLLSTRSLTPGSRYNINSGTYDLGYLDIQDYSNTNGTLTQGLALNITDSGNNTGWNLHNPVVNSIGPANFIDGSFTLLTTPTLNFNITDPDISDTVKYNIIVDNNSDFSSPEVNTTSALAAPGNLSFLVASPLASGSYYWKVKATDASNGESAFFTANSGGIAFKEDFLPTISSLGDTTVTTGGYISIHQPTFNFTVSDSDVGDTTQNIIQIDNNSDFSSPEVEYSFNQGAVGAKSFIVGQAAGAGVYTHGSAAQALLDGSYYWRVKAIDNHAGESAYTVANGGSLAFIVNTIPTLSNLGPTNLIDGTYRIDRQPTFTFDISDVNAGDTQSFTIQIDNNSDFSSPEINFTSPLGSTGPRAYTASTPLADGGYYWRVKSIDNHSGDSGFTNASSGVAFNINSIPVTGNLGPANLTDGTYSLNHNPTFNFNISDVDAGDSIKFNIQVDDTPDFSSPVIDYTSGLDVAGNKTFTVGQIIGTGTYSLGSAGQNLADGGYYWRVKAIDNHAAESVYSNASVSVAFNLNTIPTVANLGPTNLIDGSYTINRQPSLTFDTSDVNVGDTVKFIIQIDNDSTFTSPEVEFTSELNSTGGKTFDIPVALADGTYYWRVKVIDNHLGESEYTTANNGGIAFNVNSIPTVSDLGLPEMVNGTYTLNHAPTFNFNISDVDTGDSIKFNIQVDNDSDFSSPVLDYTSSFDVEGDKTFTVGQAIGTGTYSIGTVGQVLSDGGYYWRVKSLDNRSAESEYSNASSGVSFNVNTIPSVSNLGPADLINGNYSLNRLPQFTFELSDIDSADFVRYTIQIDNNSDFSSPEINFTSELKDLGEQNYIADTELSDGSYYWRIKAIDDHLAESDYTFANNGDVAFNVNSIPNINNLGPSNFVDGSYTLNRTPRLTFEVGDVNTGDTVKYTIQVDNNSDYSSPEVNFTSDLEAAGQKTFDIPSPLLDGSYYWRVKTIDNHLAESEYLAANAGEVAFNVNTIPAVSNLGPTEMIDGSFTLNRTPEFAFIVSDVNEQDTIAFHIQIDNNTDFSSPEIDFTSGFGNVDNRTYISDIPLVDGAYYWRVKAIDNHAGESEYSVANGGEVAFNVNTIPVVSNLGPEELVNQSFSLDQSPTFTFDLSDVNEGDTIKYNFQLASNINFDPVVVDYTSDLQTTINRSFTVGQPVEGGTYTAGVENQKLPFGNFTYYWRVKAIDSRGASGEYSNATEDNYAFGMDITEPTGTTSIEEIDNNFNPYLVNLLINGEDNLSGVTSMIVSDNEGFLGAAFQPYENEIGVTLTDGSGVKSIFVKLKDKAENESSIITATIIVIKQPDKINSPVAQIQTIAETVIPDIVLPPEVISFEKYNLSLKVVDKENNPVGGVRVTLDSDSIEATTNENGVAEFKDVAKGKHTIFIKRDGYNQEVTIDVGGVDQTLQVRFVLDEIKKDNTLIYVIITLFILVVVSIPAGLYLKKKVSPKRIMVRPE